MGCPFCTCAVLYWTDRRLQQEVPRSAGMRAFTAGDTWRTRTRLPHVSPADPRSSPTGSRSEAVTDSPQGTWTEKQAGGRPSPSGQLPPGPPGHVVEASSAELTPGTASAWSRCLICSELQAGITRHFPRGVVAGKWFAPFPVHTMSA